MAEIATAGEPAQCRTDGGVLLRNGFASASQAVHNGGHKSGRAASFSVFPPVHAPDNGVGVAKAGVTADAAESLIVHKRIGERIKSLRQRKHMGLVELGRHTGLSASFLSQLETGRVVPTLRNLARIAMVFSKDLSYFFEPERPELFRILRAAERQRLPQTGAHEPDYFFESLGQVPGEQMIAPYIAEFLAGKEHRPPSAHQHNGAEFIYVFSGCLRIAHEGRTEVLEHGDAAYFDPSVKHSYERVGEEPCTALILTMPEPMNGSHAAARPGVAAATSESNGTGAGVTLRRQA